MHGATRADEVQKQGNGASVSIMLGDETKVMAEAKGTYKGVHLTPCNLPRFEPAPATRQVPITPSKQLSPLGSQGTEDGSRAGDLLGRAAKDDAPADAGAQLGYPSCRGRWGQRDGSQVGGCLVRGSCLTMSRPRGG